MKKKLGRPRIHPITYPFATTFDRANYSELYLMRCVSETQVQADIIQLLKLYAVDVAAIDAGGKRARGVLIARAKSSGLSIGALASAKTGSAIPKGYADLEGTLAPSGRSLFIEVKAPAWYSDTACIRPAGVPSEEQLEFLFEKHKRGAFVLIAWAAKDVTNALGELLVANRRSLNKS